MSKSHVDESVVETASLAWSVELGHQVLFGPDIAEGELAEEHTRHDKVVLEGRLGDER